MESDLTRYIYQNWERKAIAIVAAIVVWVLVNQSITETKTIANVPIRVVNLPTDKTILGLLPNGYISQRVTLTLSGSKDVIQELDQGDLEVQMDASTAESDDWVALITKKNLRSLNPSLDLRHHINSVEHPEFVIKLSDLVTEKVPIYVKTPLGDPPQGYEFLDIWPEKLTQTLSGPKEEVQELKIKGLKLNLDMSRITKMELDSLKHSLKQGHDDEISYAVPEQWKKVPIPFRNDIPYEINDPEAKSLRINFLRKRLLPIGKEIPVTIYYPIKFSETINPRTHSIGTSDLIRQENEITLFSQPLYVKDVSRLFLDIVRDNIEIVVIAAPKSERETLHWSVEIIDSKEMEDTYVAYVLADQKDNGAHITDTKKREELLRKRFRDYQQKLFLYTADGSRLKLFPVLEDETIVITTTQP